MFRSTEWGCPRLSESLHRVLERMLLILRVLDSEFMPRNTRIPSVSGIKHLSTSILRRFAVFNANSGVKRIGEQSG